MLAEDSLTELPERFLRSDELVRFGLHEQCERFTGDLSSSITTPNAHTVWRRAKFPACGEF